MDADCREEWSATVRPVVRGARRKTLPWVGGEEGERTIGQLSIVGPIINDGLVSARPAPRSRCARHQRQKRVIINYTPERCARGECSTTTVSQLGA
jgi:hypothetical protein